MVYHITILTQISQIFQKRHRLTNILHKCKVQMTILLIVIINNILKIGKGKRKVNHDQGERM